MDVTTQTHRYRLTSPRVRVTESITEILHLVGDESNVVVGYHTDITARFWSEVSIFSTY